MQPAVWCVYPLVAVLLDRHWQARPRALGVLGIAAFLASLHHLTARFPLPSRRLTMLLAGASLGLALAASLWVRWAGRDRAGEALRGL